MNKNSRILIWGIGSCFRYVYEKIAVQYGYTNIVALVDIDAEDKQSILPNIKVITPYNIKKLEYDIIVVSVINTKKIKEQVNELSIDKDKVIYFWEDERNIYIRNLEYLVQNAPYENTDTIYRPIIRSSKGLLNKIISEKCSLSRFGDGEFEIMLGRNRAWFQNKSEDLAKRLKEVFTSYDAGNIIAIPDNFGNLDKYTNESADAIREYNYSSRNDVYKFIDFDRIYYNAYVTRPYLIYKDKSHADVIFKLFKAVWKDRDICIVEGKYSRAGINNDLFDGVKSISRVLCPPKNAFDIYDDILNNILNKVNKDVLVVISLGPTASVLAYDLFKVGYQAIDIGQLDNEYDWYKAKVTDRCDIKGKQVAEFSNTVVNKAIDNKEYWNQIISDLST